jgi:hypothetical protein
MMNLASAIISHGLFRKPNDMARARELVNLDAFDIRHDPADLHP